MYTERMSDSRVIVKRGSYFLLYNRYNNVIHAWPGFAQGGREKRLGSPSLGGSMRIEAYVETCNCLLFSSFSKLYRFRKIFKKYPIVNYKDNAAN